MNLPSKIWEGKVVAGPNNCHIFTGQLVHGYGYIWKDGATRRAHRVIYEECWGPVPEGLYVLHKCNVRRCVNPLHLYAGTPKENMQDRKEAGGYVFNEESRLKMRNARLGKSGTPHSKESKLKISLKMKGFSDELIQRILSKS